MTSPAPVMTHPRPAAPDGDLARSATRLGVFYGLACYGWWGLVAVYFKAVAAVPAPEVLAHRIVWSLVLCLVLMRFAGGWGAARAALSSRRAQATLAGSTVLIAGNWFIFIWCVATGRILESSLGYFINPLVNVLLGRIFLSERLRPWQLVSVGLAAAGVAGMALSLGVVPWASLFLAASFGLYGLLRKTARVDSLAGLTLETALLTPLALGWLAFQGATGRLAFGGISRGTDLLLVLSGVVTAVPLLWFAGAARRLPLRTLGFLQYLSPSLQFLLAVAAYGEPFTRAHLFTFGCIWTALAIYSVEAARAARRARVDAAAGGVADSGPAACPASGQ